MEDKATTRFRKLLAGDDLIVAPGAHDPFTARIIEDLGFPAVYQGGYAMGTHLVTGEPLTTLTETIDCCLRLRRAVGVPLIVDGDSGFGDAMHTYRTVKEFERAGVAAIHLEDQPFPKRAHYHKNRGRVTDLEEVMERMNAAVEARTDPDFVLIGRTDALRVTRDMDETLRRCRAYLEASMDMLMIMGPTVEDAKILRSAFPTTPMVWLSGTFGTELSTQEVAELGFKLMIYPVTTSVTITDAVTKLWTRVRDTGRISYTDEFVAEQRSRIMDLIGMPKYWEIEERTTERE